MGYETKIGRDGQLVVPEELIRAAGFMPGTPVIVEVGEDGRFVLKRRRPTPEEVEAWLDRAWGSATTDLTTEEIMAMTRGED